ncbi:MAG: hypothetical protein GXO89_13755, partial [Chlorobi bacterium]|nr:hypothetical protein [Chlorobiota bacterium]
MKTFTFLISALLLFFFTMEAQSQNKSQTPGYNLNKSKINKQATKKEAGFNPDGYCIASGGCDEYIGQVIFGIINNSTFCNQYSLTSYASVDIPLNGFETITVVNGNPYSPDQCGIWVDWNRDEDFDDAGESFTVSGSPGNGPYTASISPPAGTTLGICRIRIRITYNMAPTPCGDDTWGEVEDYLINVTPKVPNEWTGNVNHDWNDGLNWSLNHMPTDDEDVIITNAGWQPAIYNSDVACNNLTIETGGGLEVLGKALTVNGNMLISGQLAMSDTNGTINCYGNVNWNNNSTADFTASTMFNVYGNWFFNSGSDAQIENGWVAFRGSGDSQIKSKSPSCYLHSVYINKSSAALRITSDANNPLVMGGNINIQPGSQFINESTQDIICRGDFYNAGFFDFSSSAGTNTSFIFNGVNQSITMDVAFSFFNNLKINPSGWVNMYSGDINVDGDLTIESSIFYAQGNTIYLQGDWINNVGTGAFDEGTGRVVFSGTAIQNCSTEVFNILEINNPAGAIYVSGTNVICNAYDWTAGAIDVFNGGTFTANDLIDNGIYGKYVLSGANSTINLTNSDGYVDLNGEININCGTMNVFGGTTPSYWPFDHDAIITMICGVLDFHDQGIYVYNSPTYLLTDNISGGFIRTAGGFIGERADFTPSNGTFEFYGMDDYFLSQANGCTLYNVIIDKGSKSVAGKKTPAPIIDKRSKKIISDGGKSNINMLGSDFVITNDLTINSGELKLGGNGLSVGEDCWVDGTLTMDNSADILTIGQNYWNQISFYSGSVANLANGTLNCYGWVDPKSGCSFNASTYNTIVFKGASGGGISNHEPTATYGNIVLDKNANQTTFIDYNATEPIIVNGSFTINPNNILITQVKTVVVHGSFTDQASSEIYAYVTTKSNGPGSSLQKPNGLENSKTISGALEIDSDFTLKGLMDLGPDGMVVVHGVSGIAVSGSLIIDGGSFIADGPNHLDWEYFHGNLSISDGLFEITNNSISFGPTTTTNVSGGTIRTGEAFNASFPSTPGIFVPTGGVVELIGNISNSYIYCPTGNSFYNLRINCPSGKTMILNSPSVSVTNDVTIDAGYLEIGSLDNIELLVGGNWSDNVVGGLIPNTG